MSGDGSGLKTAGGRRQDFIYRTMKRPLDVSFAMTNPQEQLEQDQEARRQRCNIENLRSFTQFLSKNPPRVRYGIYQNLAHYVTVDDLINDTYISVLKTIDNRKYWVLVDENPAKENERWILANSEDRSDWERIFHYFFLHALNWNALHALNRNATKNSRAKAVPDDPVEEIHDPKADHEDDWVLHVRLRAWIGRLIELRPRITSAFKDASSNAYRECLRPKRLAPMLSASVIGLLDEMSGMNEEEAAELLLDAHKILERYDQGGWLSEPDVSDAALRKRRSQMKKDLFSTILRTIDHFNRLDGYRQI